MGGRRSAVGAGACALALLFLGVPEPGSAQGLMLTGYADLETHVEKLGSGNKEFYFDNYHFNVIALGRLTASLFAAAEVEYEHAGEEIALEYGYVAYTGLPDVTVAAGKFIVPFGRFNKDLHPTWINKVIGRPYGFGNVFPQTYSDVGLWVAGAKAVNPESRVVFDLFAVNGLLGEEGDDIRGMRDNDRERLPGGGRNDNKALGGRLGLELPFQGLDLGGSLYTGDYAEVDGRSLNLLMVGVDGSFQRAGFVLRGEFVRAVQEMTKDDLIKLGGYVQATYLVTPRFEPGVQFSAQDMPAVKGIQSNDLTRIAVGASFYLSSAAAIRVYYHINREEAGKKDDNALLAQFAISF